MENYIIAALDARRRIPRLHHLRDRENPFEITVERFTKLFRFPQELVINLIEILDGPRLNSGYIPKHLKVLTALQFFAQGSYQSAVGQDYLLELSQPSVSRVIHQVADLIVTKLAPQLIKFPTTLADKESAKAEFQALYNMPNTLGAVDGTHIAIAKPKLNHPIAPGSLFYNRKGFYSINCQIVCNAKGKIISLNANFPGSTHDAAIWRASNVFRRLQQDFLHQERNQWLLGDKGYPLQPWLMTPIMVPRTGAEASYNTCHARARNVVEMLNGRLKNKFRCLHRHRSLHYEPENAGKIIIACCTLYNYFFVVMAVEDNVEIEEEEHEEEPESSDYLTEAREIRNQLINTYFV